MSRRRGALAVAAVLAVLGAGFWLLRPGPKAAPARERVRALRAERDRLREQVRTSASQFGCLTSAPESLAAASVVVGMPAGFVADTVGDAVEALFGDFLLNLEDVKAHEDGTVRVKFLLGRTRAGKYDLDINIDAMDGRLAAGAPELQFGQDEIRVRLPIAIAEGHGRATLHFVWDGKGIAGLICGDLDVRQEVSGRVRPGAYLLEGRIRLLIADGAFQAQPEFDYPKVRVFLEPSAGSWAAIESVIESKKGLCGAVLDRVDLISVLKRLLERGIEIKLPRALRRPVTLPVGFAQSVTVGSHAAEFVIEPAGHRVADGILWYGASIQIRRTPTGGDGTTANP